MHRSELDRVETCVLCGRAVVEGAERGYDFGSKGLLCWECGIARGGRYDEERDTWSVPPRVADLGGED